MKRINRKLKTTFIFSTHDKRVIAKADRLVRVEDGEISLLGMRRDAKWSFARHRATEEGTGSNGDGRTAAQSTSAGERADADQN